MTRATPEALWPILEDLTTHTEWGIWDDVRIENTGDATRQRQGMIRAMRAGRHTVREMITRVVAGSVLEYRLLSGLPVRDYTARVSVEPYGRGTRVVWQARFKPTIPFTGGAVQRKLGEVFEELLSRLTAYAEIRLIERPVA